MKSIVNTLTAAVFLAVAGTGFAATYQFDGSTVGTSTFHRPTGDEFPNTPGEPDLSGFGEEWSFHTIVLTVDQSGDYDIGVTSNTFDTYLILYTSFDPANPTQNILALLDGADESATFAYETLLSGISLEAGTTYTLVTTSFWDNVNGDSDGNTPAGSFSGNISGPGNITVIPEPSAILLGALGFTALLRRRSRAA